MKGIVLFALVALTSVAFISEKSSAAGVIQQPESICGKTDSRRSSKQKPIARLVDSADGEGGCTGTMISKTCMVTAGHCNSVFEYAQFNVPKRKKNGKRAINGMDVYELDRTIAYRDDGIGSDWAVLKFKPNSFSGKNAGDAQGYLKLKTSALNDNQTKLRITGYGMDDEPKKDSLQQSATGELVAKNADLSLDYVVDTMPGNSGSAVVLDTTKEIVGIHTNGGCTVGGGSNAGTALAGNVAFQQAIEQCLATE